VLLWREDPTRALNSRDVASCLQNLRREGSTVGGAIKTSTDPRSGELEGQERESIRRTITKSATGMEKKSGVFLWYEPSDTS